MRERERDREREREREDSCGRGEERLNKDCETLTYIINLGPLARRLDIIE